MKFKMRVKEIGGKTDWWEEYDRPGTDAYEIAGQIMKHFHETLRPGEKRRRVIEIVVLDIAPTGREHKWVKVTGVSQRSRSGLIYDQYRCENCGITGKRFGLASNILMDRKYKAKYYKHCGDTQKRLKEKGLLL